MIPVETIYAPIWNEIRLSAGEIACGEIRRGGSEDLTKGEALDLA